jgi:histidine triad (HIT) family protein
MNDCLFCRIVAKKIPSKVVYEDDRILAFQDTHPQAPVHLLIIPKKHFDTLLDIHEEDLPLLTHLMESISRLANEHGLAKSGFRTVINTGPKGGQTIYHLHLHLIGGRQMTWPPG